MGHGYVDVILERLMQTMHARKGRGRGYMGIK